MSDESRQPTHHGYAVNVKDDKRYRVDYGTLTDDQVDAIWQGACEGFWMSAQKIGKEYGFRRVYGEGRSGGWCVPYPQPDAENMWEDELEAWVLDRFRPFERDVLSEMEHYQGIFEEDLTEAIEYAAGEPARRQHEADEVAYWAARGVEAVAG